MRHWVLLWALLLCVCGSTGATGFDEHYKIRAGDLESDGDLDLFVGHAAPLILIPAGAHLLAPIALDRSAVQEFVLRNDGGELRLVTGAAAMTGRYWKAASHAALSLGDFNADDRLDAMIKRAGATPLQEYVAFAGDTLGVAPKLTRVDGGFREVVDTLHAWLFDRGYFDALSPPREHIFLGNGLSYSDHLWLWSYCNRYYDHCYARYGDLNLIVPALFGMSCTTYVVLEGSWTGNPCRVGYHVWGSDTPLLRQDFSGTVPLVANFIQAVQAWLAKTGSLDTARGQLESLLKVPVGGLDFGSAATFDDLDEVDERKEFELVEALLSLWHALHGRPTAVDTVYLTAHPVLRVGPAHTALEYTYRKGLPLGHLGPQLLSAGPQKGRLVYTRNRRTDRGNHIYGKVTSRLYVEPRMHFDALRQAAENYDDDLEYVLFPEGREGYNSNSFVAGLLVVTESQSPWPMTSFVGGGKPVPSSEFH